MIRTERDPELRVQIVDGCQQFAENPAKFRDACLGTNKELTTQIEMARALLPEVKMPEDIRLKISEVCSELNVDGLRGDIVTNRAARAYTAYCGRKEVEEDDVEKIISLCLRHRLRKDVLDTMDSGDKVLKTFKTIFEDE